MRNEINFVDRRVSARDRELTLGPFDDQDGPFVDLTEDWSMAHVMHAAGAFPSVGEAKRNGWARPVPAGFGEFVVGRSRLRVFTLTPLAA